MFKTFALVSVLFTLAACGGGGSAPSGPATPDNTQAIMDALDKVADKLPPAPTTYTGAFAAVGGKSVGFVSGKSPVDAVRAAVAPIVADATKHAVLYQMLLSDKGLNVTLYGEKIGTGVASGLPLYAPDTSYVVKLTANGITIN